MEKLAHEAQPPTQEDLDWYENFEWGPEPPEMWMPASEESLGEDF